MFKFIKFSIIFLFLINIFSIFILIVHAEETAETLPGLLPNQQSGLGGEDICPKDNNGNPVNCGNYSLNDIVSVAVKISQFILSIVGSLALLAFVAGGLMMMLSAGNAEWVTRGRQTLIGAIIGLTIVFTSFMIIQLVFTSLGVESKEKNNFGAWSISSWFK